MIARHLIIAGQVQGVGYREWLRSEAQAKGLSGWVRNRAEGAVEAVLAGEAAVVRHVIATCRHGPPHARVDRIAETEMAPPAEPGFHLLPTL